VSAADLPHPRLRPSYRVDVAWLWWLLAPVASTGVGALVLAARSSRPAGSGRRAMTEHQRLLAALAGQHPAEPEPGTIRLLTEDRSGSVAG